MCKIFARTLLVFSLLVAHPGFGQNTIKDQIVIDSYLEAFGAAPSDPERKYWMSRTDWTTKANLVDLHRQHLRNSAEAQDSAVRFAYIRMYNRVPNQDELKTWLPEARKGTTSKEIETRIRELYAQEANRDPWIAKAFQEVLGRKPVGLGTGGEWDVKNYGGGNWSDYDDLVNKVRVKMTRQGVAYIFIKPEQAVYQGHIGWGYIMDNGKYRYGSTENPMKPANDVGQGARAVWDAINIGHGADNGYWHGTADTLAEMLADMKRNNTTLTKSTKYPYGFRCSGYWRYKSSIVASRNVASANAAGENCRVTGFKGIGWNCLDQTYSMLEAYGVDKSIVMPWKQTHPSPNYWYNHFGGLDGKTLQPFRGNNTSGHLL